jgi:hypothetical protein
LGQEHHQLIKRVHEIRLEASRDHKRSQSTQYQGVNASTSVASSYIQESKERCFSMTKLQEIDEFKEPVTVKKPHPQSAIDHQL